MLHKYGNRCRGCAHRRSLNRTSRSSSHTDHDEPVMTSSSCVFGIASLANLVGQSAKRSSMSRFRYAYHSCRSLQAAPPRSQATPTHPLGPRVRVAIRAKHERNTSETLSIDDFSRAALWKKAFERQQCRSYPPYRSLRFKRNV